MCIIIASKGKRISEKTFLNCWVNNPHGVGLVWEEGLRSSSDLSTKIIKTTSLFDAWKAYAEIPANRNHVVHFRYASSGIAIQKELCHPFKIDEKGTADFGIENLKEGKLLFHNGTIKNWREGILNFIMKHDTQVDAPYSDTKFAAMLAHYHGIKALDLLAGAYDRLNRFLIWDCAAGNWEILQKKLWIEDKDIFFSNADYQGYKLAEEQ